jgi:hypothetical protein
MTNIQNMTHGSILDFPRKRLPDTIWIYDSPDELPRLNSSLRSLILNTSRNYLLRYNLRLRKSMLYGGAASYQWSPGTDIDVSLYAEGWPEDVRPDEVEFIQEQFKDIELPFEGYPVHFFLKPPKESSEEVADAVYDIIEDEWVLPPLVLPEGFDPDEYFAPLIKSAEAKAAKFDVRIGELKRAWKILRKSAEAKKNAREPELVEKRIRKQKKRIKDLMSELARAFHATREKRYAMHDRLREKMRDDVELGRFERFQEPEIVWKYLDRSGHVDFLWKIYKVDQAGTIDNILAKY